MPDNTLEIYPRVKIALQITFRSAAHIGSGIRNKKDSSDSYTELCLDINAEPYIPASSLKGFLRSRLIMSGMANDEIERLCGTARQGKENTQGQAGALRIYDATWLNNNPALIKSSSNSIDPVTQTAQAHHLFSWQMIATGSIMDWQIEADYIQHDLLEKLIKYLKQIHSDCFAQLGQGLSSQKGLFDLSVEKVKTLSQDSLRTWLQKKGEQDFQKLFYLNSNLLDIKTEKNSLESENIVKINLKINTQTPLLINKPDYQAKKTEDPDLVYQSNKSGCLLIPATSLKGLFRSHCRKIILTLVNSYTEALNNDKKNEITDYFINEVFGSTDKQGRFWLSDALSDTKPVEHEQMFNAIDRFTGAVLEGALYKIRAAIADDISGTLMIHKTLFEHDWFQGLLFLLHRDTQEEDLSLGWGKSKGFGMLHINMPELEKYPAEKRQEKVIALNNLIKDILKETEELGL